MCCSKDKFVAIAAPRGHAKSTAITLAYTLACILFRQRKFVIVISDTEAQAVLFTSNIKKELMENDDIRTLFGVKDLLKDTESDYIVRFEDGWEARVVAKGSEQKLRGLNWKSFRPDLIIGDDMENDEIVMNKERREKFRRWFTGAVIPCLSKSGVIRIIGTILHMDSLLANYMPQVWNKDTIITPLCNRSGKRMIWTSAQYRAHPSMTDFSQLLWKEYRDVFFLKAEQARARAQGQTDLYAQEYLNEPIDDTTALFKRSDFKAMSVDDINADLTHAHYYIAMDLAVTKDSVKTDFTVFTVANVTSENKLQVRQIIHERMDAQEVVDSIIQLQRIYKPMFFVVEKGAITNSILPFLRIKMSEENVWPLIHMVNNDTDKVRRSNSIRGRMRAGNVYFDKSSDWFSELEQECVQFPRGRHDDQVDTMSLLGIALDKFIEAPTKEEVFEQEYEDEKTESGFYDDGKSAICGY